MSGEPAPRGRARGLLLDRFAGLRHLVELADEETQAASDSEVRFGEGDGTVLDLGEIGDVG